jgi:hypothetical protein
LKRPPLRLVPDKSGEPPKVPAAPAADNPVPTNDERMDPKTRDRMLLGIALFALLLIVGSVWVMERLLEIGKIQDCVWQGRRNCAPISSPPR